MENVHKKIIRSNHCFLLEHCNFQTLLPKLIENKVFTKTSIPLYEASKFHIIRDIIKYNILSTEMRLRQQDKRIIPSADERS